MLHSLSWRVAGFVPGHESSHLLSGEHNTPTIHAFLLVDGEVGSLKAGPL